MPNHTVSGNVDTMMRAADNAGIRSAIGVGTTDAPTFLAQTLTGQSLTGTQATSLVDLSATWNTSGTPSLIYARVTTTNANNAAKLLDLGTLSQGQVFSVNRYGGVASADSVSVASGSHMSGTTVGVGPAGRFGFSSNTGNSSGFVFSTGLYQDDPGILAQRNGTAKQALRVYNTALSGAPEWGEFDWITSGGTNTLRIGTNLSGTGVARTIHFVIGGTPTWVITTSGHLQANTDSAYDIGASGANRPRNVFIANTLSVGGNFNCTNMFSNGPLVPIRLLDGTGNDFSRLQLGGTADTHPAIARDGAGIKITGAATGLTSWIKVPAVAVSALPLAATAGVGARSFVNDALTPVFGSAVTGGGAVTVPVYSTGSAWNVG